MKTEYIGKHKVFLDDVYHEYNRANTLYPHFHSYHEGYAVIKEELDEMWDEIKKKQADKQRIYEEATQVAAMCLKLIISMNSFGES